MSRLPIVGCLSVLVIGGVVPLAAQETAAWKDPSPHKASFATVDKDVRLEVLDWGGSGRPLVLLAGLGNTAHVFDDFAPKLTSDHHVLGITRRGYGASTVAPSGYGANRLGDDVLAVLDSLKLERPVLVGHSIAGEELSSVGSRHPDRVAGLVYLDAALQYAFDNGKGSTMAELREGMERLPSEPSLTSADLKDYATLGDWFVRTRGVRLAEAEIRQQFPVASDERPGKQRTPESIPRMVQDGIARFSEINVPVLALCVIPIKILPYHLNLTDPGLRAAVEAHYEHRNTAKEKQTKSFEEGIPHSRVVRVPNADHHIFISNEAEVLREMRVFVSDLK